VLPVRLNREGDEFAYLQPRVLYLQRKNLQRPFFAFAFRSSRFWFRWYFIIYFSEHKLEFHLVLQCISRQRLSHLIFYIPRQLRIHGISVDTAKHNDPKFTSLGHIRAISRVVERIFRPSMLSHVSAGSYSSELSQYLIQCHLSAPPEYSMHSIS
jgi:hypothetical protein